MEKKSAIVVVISIISVSMAAAQGTQYSVPEIEVLSTDYYPSNSTAVFKVNATDPGDEKLLVRFYLIDEKIASKEGYGVISASTTNVTDGIKYRWDATASDGYNTTNTGAVFFNTSKQKWHEEEKESHESHNHTHEASNTGGNKSQSMGIIGQIISFFENLFV